MSARGVALLVVGAASVVGAYLIGLPELLFLGVFSLGLPLAAVLSVLLRRLDLRVVRSFSPAGASVGRPTTVTLSIRGGPASARLDWSDPTPWAGAAGEIARGETGLPSAAAVEVSYRLTPPRRGLFAVGPLRVALADPFGLCRATLSVGDSTAFLVLPVVEPLSVTALSAVSSEGRMSAVRRTSGGQDDLSTREYRAGDALRRVHWRATARYGELMVRQEEAASHAEVRIVLDTRRGGYLDLTRAPDHPESETFERAVSVVTSAALHFSRLGYTVDLVELGAGHLAPIVPTAPFLRSVATLELSEENASATALPRHTASAQGAIIAVLATADAPTIARLAALRVGCHPLVAFVVGPETEAGLGARNRLAAAGWDCVAVLPDTTVEQVWQSAAVRYRASNVS